MHASSSPSYDTVTLDGGTENIKVASVRNQTLMPAFDERATFHSSLLGVYKPPILNGRNSDFPMPGGPC